MTNKQEKEKNSFIRGFFFLIFAISQTETSEKQQVINSKDVTKNS